ncbi:Transposase, partial [Dissostichus eleginoides]
GWLPGEFRYHVCQYEEVVSLGDHTLRLDVHTVEQVKEHNHNLFVADAIRHRDVGEKANNILTGLFEIGHTPTSALAVLKHDLQMEYGQRYVYVSANREICPDLPYVQRLFHKVCREEYGTQTGPTMLAALKLQVEIYNNKCNDTCALLGTTSQGAPLVVVCSPLMKKVHQLKHSGELCFIDSSGNMDRENCRVFLLLTHSCAGGLPLGILLCQSEDEQTIAQGLEQLKQVVGEKGFAGRGHEGPQLVITDDCRAERGALRKAFPKATLLLCSFHLLQAVWRWLWSKESGVTHGDRPALFAIVKEMLYCQEIGSVDRLYSEARGHPVAASYEKFLRHLDRLYARRERWALSYRGSFLTRGNNTNNFAEAAMRVLKDKILQRTKAFNLPQLFDLLTSRLETYYEARIVDVALGRWESFQRAKFLPKMATLQHRIFSRLRTRRQTGAPCKHQAAVMKNDSCLSHSFLPINPEMRAELMKLTSAGTHEPSTTHQEQQDEGVLTEQAQPSRSVTGDRPQEDIASDDVSLVDNMMEEMKSRCQDPHFTAGLLAMAKQYNVLRSNPSKLLSAFHSFGKSGSLTSKRAAILRRAARRQGPMIGCQPTAVARRKSGAGSRRRLFSGRPVKQHSLSLAVVLNTSHSKKH